MTDQVRIVIGRLEEVAEEVITKLSLRVTQNLIQATPVDVGWAQANWVPSVGAPRTLGPTPTTRDGRARAVASAAAAQAAGQARVLGYRLGPAVFISNGVPYISALNNGSSVQAPSAFVQAAIEKGVRSLQGVSFR